MESLPMRQFMTEGFLKGLGNGDTWDLFWYNNAEASGEELYPDGLSKYFDLYSWPGWVGYFLMYLYYAACSAIAPFTLFIPLNIWFKLLEGASFEGVWKILIPAQLSWFFHVTGE